jgi:chemotaxis regulatin CheY-phosphate phosphatase CheZ
MSIMSAMEFQDLTAQRLAATIKSVEEIRERLLQILSLFYLPFEPDEPTRAKVPETQAEISASERQALADQLLAEMADRGPQPSR